MRNFFYLLWLLPFTVISQNKSLIEIAATYSPKEIRVDLPDFASLDLKIDNDKNELASFIILLKLYDYHLKCCHQSYDLLRMFKVEQDTVLDIALDKMKVDKRNYREGLGSWAPYEYLEDNPSLFKKNSTLKALKKSIRVTRKNIDKGKYWKN